MKLLLLEPVNLICLVIVEMAAFLTWDGWFALYGLVAECASVDRLQNDVVSESCRETRRPRQTERGPAGRGSIWHYDYCFCRFSQASIE